MPRRLLRALIWIGLLILVSSALVIGGIVASAPHLLKGTTTARQGLTNLIHDPKAAASDFRAAENELTASYMGIRGLPEPTLLPTFIPPFSWVIRLNKASVYLSRAGSAAATLAEAYPAPLTTTDPGLMLAYHHAALNQLMDSHNADIKNLEENLQFADQELQHIPNWVFWLQGKNGSQLRNGVHELATTLPTAREFLANLRLALGAGTADPITSLIIFQNNAELRPSGGFMGSYAVVTASGGTIRSFQFGKDIYAIDRDLTAKEKIPTPPILRTIAPWWGFRDSNIGEGFLPDLGPQVASFYQKATGKNPQVILFLDLSVFEDVLRLTGPLPIPGTDRVATAETVATELSAAVEQDYWKLEANRQANQPKQAIGDLIPKVLEAMVKVPASELPGLLRNGIARKSIQLWSANEKLEHFVQDHMPTDLPTQGDWLKIVNTNLGGQKSSRNIVQQVSIRERGLGTMRERTITIKRTHTGTGTWPDGENHNYLEVYLPPEARDIEAPTGKGGDILLPPQFQEGTGLDFDRWPGEVLKTDQWVRVGFWATTSIAEQTEFTLVYRVPNTAAFRGGEFRYLKQAGAVKESLQAFGFDGTVNTNVTLEKPFVFW